MKKILIVDDEVRILSALGRMFWDTDYEVISANSGEEALAILDHTAVDLVISDMKMPYMDGYMLLDKIKERYPKTIRTILSGYAEEKTVFKAVLNNIAKAYFYKPWNNEDLLNSINNLFEIEEILNSKELFVLFNKLDKLPTVDTSYQNILNMIDNDANIVTIAAEIEKDPSTSTMLLHTANSAVYGVKIGSIRHAAVYIGLQNLKHLIYSMAIINADMLTQSEYKQVKLTWEHSLLTNRILHYLYTEYLHKKLPDTAVAAGLLHNVGIIILLKSDLQKYVRCRLKAEKDDLEILDLEIEEFTVTHQETGGYLSSWWGLPYDIIESTLFHHTPLEDNIRNKELVSCIHIAQHYAWNVMGIKIVSHFYPEVFHNLEINQSSFEEKFFAIDWV